MSAINTEIQRLAAELVKASRDYRAAKAAYADAFARRMTHDRSAAQAQRDLDDAMRGGTWLQGEVAALGSALSGLCLSQMGEPQ